MSDPSAVEGVDGVDVGWEDAKAANLANWEERVPLHVEGYGLNSFRDDPAHLSSVVRTDLEMLTPHLPEGSLEGLDLCHLQCHIGTDTVSLARAGAARVVGVDFSPSALTAAAGLADELGVHADWVQGDVLEARALVDAALGEDTLFDVVYTSIGTITWLADLHAWARQIEALLKPGGVFYIRDSHPMMFTLDERRDDLTMAFRYFGDGRPMQWDDASTYVGDGTIAATRTYDYPHALSEVVTVLLEAGLTLEAMHEGRTLPWHFAPRMVEVGDGEFAFPGDEAERVPCTFTLVARKPESPLD
ncbi:class I SAM-dependent methyltransferase [Demequina zhanjiangensis]|uniref:Class I SAM-dependent methyltransferase n=1 Tax=Demequina zhanjiangensis TaxID=3051659 RepID=A0ABT8FYM7_9MICO|nr:class I SAM-dependent methyltransferase [Demequina sp. SYSU T00b26]MDN4471544.1 class I SAM-dependent methyltransferase [Demequina sp. SYSU T00b26]